MKIRTLLVMALVAAGCSSKSEAPSDRGTWVGTITTEGNVTTVVNDSGSVWGGTARLVEEASIGVDAGAEEYMFGNPVALWATDDEIYVVDSQRPAVRVYDHNGVHLRNIGRRGQGPGEYLQPSGIVVDAEGRIYVREGDGNNRINVYEHGGGVLDTWTWQSSARLVGGQFVMGHDGNVYTQAATPLESPVTSFFVSRNRRRRMQQLGPSGAVGDLIAPPDLDYEPLTVTGSTTLPIAYSPALISAFTPSGAYLAGVNDAYRFEIHRRDGSIIAVERYWTPVPVSPDHAELLQKRMTASLRANDPEWTWNGPPIPAHKTAYSVFRPTQGDRVIVESEGPSHAVRDCSGEYNESLEPCYETERVWSMFDLEGRFLGPVERPGGPIYAPFFRESMAVVVFEDDTGTYVVIRYRLVPPGTAPEPVERSGRAE